MKRIAAMTTVRNDEVFLRKWIDYYSVAFGDKNLFVILDGHDQKRPGNADGINILSLPFLPMERSLADRRRARVMSHFAGGLHHYFDLVIATDVDEFIVVDPKLDMSLAEYLSSMKIRVSVSPLGLDVGQHLRNEKPLDLGRPFLEQRQLAHVSARYTKPSIVAQPIVWGSGMHRVKGRNFKIDPSLFLFHMGMIDYRMATGKILDKDRLEAGWGNHLGRREKLFKIVTEAIPIDGDDYFDKARRYQTTHRPWYALNKPAMIPGNPVIRIPERFRNLL